MKKLLWNTGILATGFLLLGFATQNVTVASDVNQGSTLASMTRLSSNLISESQAKAIAFAHAGVSESAVTYVKVKLDYDDGIPEYEVEFYVGNIEYDYEIHGNTGAILEFDYEMENVRPNSGSNNTSSTTLITESEAKAIALAHAGVSESTVTFVKVKLDYDDGVPEYEVEFYVGNIEYDYEIHGNTGAILGYDYDMETPRPNSGSDSSTTLISEAEAKSIALAHAGVSESIVTFVKVKLDYDDGIPEYEVEFYVGNAEYDYEIHGNTGVILEFDYDMETPRPSTSTSGVADWAVSYYNFVSPKIMPDISPANYESYSTRGLIAQSIYNMQGNDEITVAYHSFTDSGSYSTAINWCYANGLMSGQSTTAFGTENQVKREEFALILQQLAKYNGKNVSTEQSSLASFTDSASISFWAKDGMSWAVQNNLMNGSNNRLSPQDSIKRVEVAVMLSAFANL